MATAQEVKEELLQLGEIKAPLLPRLLRLRYHLLDTALINFLNIDDCWKKDDLSKPAPFAGTDLFQCELQALPELREGL